MAVIWVKLRSWHVYRDASTRCGRGVPAPAELRGELPMDDRSCETCLRLLKRDEDRQAE